MLGVSLDTWCIHRPVDFEFINANYKAAIIGGAGLLYGCFERFWEEFSEKCKIPFLIWGVGICLPDDPCFGQPVSKDVVQTVARRAEHVNVRDTLTKEYYNLESAHVGPCPSVAYLSDWPKRSSYDKITFSRHDPLVAKFEHAQMAKVLRTRQGKLLSTDNKQHEFSGLVDIVNRIYGSSHVVVTTRLHGAIIAYSLGIPYVALARDEKVRAFKRLCGRGVVIEDVRELSSALDEVECRSLDRPDLSSVVDFGDWSKSFLGSLGAL